jgi:cyclin-dependent kinase regulatory subunit CKS1
MNSACNVFCYSKKYYDDCFEYRHVTGPSEIGKMILEKGTLSEEQWRALGVSMSKGWVNYTAYKLEPHVMLFRRPIGTDGTTGLVSEELRLRALAEIYRT